MHMHPHTVVRSALPAQHIFIHRSIADCPAFPFSIHSQQELRIQCQITSRLYRAQELELLARFNLRTAVQCGG